MRLEISIDGELPSVHPLSKSKVLIGSDESCDIVVTRPGISRKHLVVSIEGENFYVIDQGSTNGSFINDEKLVPGQPMKFTSFFPVKLAALVSVSLVTEADKDEVFVPKAKTQTQVLSTAEIKDAKKIPAPKKVIAPAPGPVPDLKVKPKKTFSPVPYIALAILGLGLYASLALQEDASEPSVSSGTPAPKDGQVGTPAAAPIAVVSAPAVDAKNIPSKTKFDTLFTAAKCTTASEQNVCEGYDGVKAPPFGAIQIEQDMYFLVNANKALIFAQTVLPMPTSVHAETAPPEVIAQYNQDLWETAAARFMDNNFRKGLDYKGLKDLRLHIGLFYEREGVQVPGAVISLQLPVLQSVKTLLPRQVDQVKTSGVKALTVAKKFFTVTVY